MSVTVHLYLIYLSKKGVITACLYIKAEEGNAKLSDLFGLDLISVLHTLSLTLHPNTCSYYMCTEKKNVHYMSIKNKNTCKTGASCTLSPWPQSREARLGSILQAETQRGTHCSHEPRLRTRQAGTLTKSVSLLSTTDCSAL